MICGIDEAGRGPLAGSLFICGISFFKLNKEIENSLNDSKKIAEKKRNIIANLLIEEKINKNIDFVLVEKSNLEIDKKGISLCLKEALEEIKIYFKEKEFIFDGNCNYNVSDIKTIIKADSLIKEVSAASILAKYHRDMKLLEQTKNLINFSWEKHKGYGTKKHIEEIKKYGLTDIHRKTFCQKFI